MHFLPYDGFLALAQKAAQEAKNLKHSFTTVEMPINLLEVDALTGCAQWAHDNNIIVLSKRPIDGNEGDRKYRLASADMPMDYEQKKELLRPIAQKYQFEKFMDKIDVLKQEIPSFDHYEKLVNNQIVPLLKKIILNPDEKKIFYEFLITYENAVKHFCGKTSMYK